MKVYVGMDLHATNTYVGMVDEENEVLHKQRFRNELPLILASLDPFRKDIQGVVVESNVSTGTGSWTASWQRVTVSIWPMCPPSKQYEGLKQIDDKRSALWLANPFAAWHPPYRLHLSQRGAADQRPPPEKAPSCPPQDLHILSVKKILARNLDSG